MRSCSVVSDSFLTPWTVAHQVPLTMGFPRQKYWRGLPFPSSGDLPNPGMKPASLASPELAGRFFTTESPGKSILILLMACQNQYFSKICHHCSKFFTQIDVAIVGFDKRKDSPITHCITSQCILFLHIGFSSLFVDIYLCFNSYSTLIVLNSVGDKSKIKVLAWFVPSKIHEERISSGPLSMSCT